MTKLHPHYDKIMCSTSNNFQVSGSKTRLFTGASRCAPNKPPPHLDTAGEVLDEPSAFLLRDRSYGCCDGCLQGRNGPVGCLHTPCPSGNSSHRSDPEGGMWEGHRELRPPDPSVPTAAGGSFGTHRKAPVKRRVFSQRLESWWMLST